MPPSSRPRAAVLAPLLAIALLGSTVAASTATAEATSSTVVASSASWQAAWDTGSMSTLRSWFVANTGPKVSLTRSSTGVYSVSSQAAADALVGRTVNGRVSVTASNVVLRDFKVVNDGSASSTISIAGGLSGVVLQDFEVDGRGHLTTTAAVGGASWSNVTVRRAHIHHSLDGVRLFEGSTYEHVYVTDAVANQNYVSGTSSQHADAVQAVRAAAGKPITVRQSWLDHSAVGPNVTSVAMLKSDAGTIDGLMVENNYIDGGRYTITIEAGSHGAPRNVAVRNNRFGHSYQHGLWSGAGVNNGAGYDRTGNVWADTLTPATLTWGKTATTEWSTEPVVTEPVAPEPVAPEPVAPEPVAPEPVAPEPVAPEPVAPEPVAPEPVGPEPVATQPAPTSSTTTSPTPTQEVAPTVRSSVPRATASAAGVSVTADLSVDRTTTFAKLPRIAIRDAAGRSTDALGGLDTAFGPGSVTGSIVLSGSRSLAAGTYTAFVAYSLDGTTWAYGTPTSFVVPDGMVDTGSGVRVSVPRASSFKGSAGLVADLSTTRSLKFAKLARIAVRDSAGRSRDAQGGLDLAFGPKTVNGKVLLQGSRTYAAGTYTAFVAYSLNGSTWIYGPQTSFTVR